MSNKDNENQDFGGFVYPLLSTGIRGILHGFYDWKKPPDQNWNEFVSTKLMAIFVGLGFIVIGCIIIFLLTHQGILGMLQEIYD